MTPPPGCAPSAPPVKVYSAVCVPTAKMSSGMGNCGATHCGAIEHTALYVQTRTDQAAHPAATWCSSKTSPKSVRPRSLAGRSVRLPLRRLRLPLPHVLDHLLLHLRRRRVGDVRRHIPRITLRIDQASASVAPKHVRHRPLRRGAELHCLRKNLIDIIHEQVKSRGRSS